MDSAWPRRSRLRPLSVRQLPRYRGAVPRASLPIRFSLEDRFVAGETLFLDAGANVLVLTSCSAELGIELRNAYLAGEGRDELLVAESAVVGAGPAELCTRHLEAAPDAHIDQRRRLLYDHLQRLQDLAAQVDLALAFEGVDVAASRLDPFSSTSA